MRFLFSAFPASFSISFIRKKTKKRLNLPSNATRPKLNNAFTYDSIRYESKEIFNRKRDASLIDRKFVPNKINVELKLDYATGIPSPKDTISPQDIVSRHVYVSLFDLKTKQLVGNVCRVPVFWDKEYEDRW